MSGWDTPSRPRWDPQNGPEDSTQAFPTSNGAGAGAGADERWLPPSGSGWDGADSQDPGPADLGRREPTFQDANGFPPDQGSFPSDQGGFPSDQGGFPSDQGGFPSDQGSFPSDQNGSLPRRGGGTHAQQPAFGGQEFAQRQPGATLAGRGAPGPDRYPTGPQVSARDEPPWPGPTRQEPTQLSARPDYGRGDGGPAGDYGRPDFGRPDLDRPSAPGQDFPRREPGRALTAYSAAAYSGQPDQSEQALPPMNRAEAERAARMDPALADFFAPTKPDPRYTAAGRPAASPGLAGQGPAGQGPAGARRSGPMRPAPGPDPRRGDGAGPRRPSRPNGAWDDSRRTGARARLDEHEPGGRGKMIAAIAAVVVIVAGGGSYFLLHNSGNNHNTAAGVSPTPTAATSATASATAPAANSTGAAKSPNVTGSASAAGAYLLSTPSTAGGYPIGTDPHFLATATSTVAALEQTGIADGGGTASGNPVSASYTLPDEQTIEFVGYQGTFDPTKVMSNLASFGSSEMTYPAGPNGGDLACANTTATASTASGAVCVWVTKTTLGFTEFFMSDGPEALNSAQSKGAQDTINLRASVEKLKS